MLCKNNNLKKIKKLKEKKNKLLKKYRFNLEIQCYEWFKYLEK